VQLTLVEARRLAVQGQLLAGPKPRSIVEVVEAQLGVQMDPTAAVARTEQLVLWSRLGHYDVAELYRLLYEERALFEYWAYIVAMSDLPLFRDTMRRYPRGETKWAAYIRTWLELNRPFRNYILRELRRRGQLRSRELEDRAVVPYPSDGWNKGRNLTMMLERLWAQGAIAIVGREGGERVWGLAEHALPVAERLPAGEVARRVLERQLRRAGVARANQFGFVFDGRPPQWERALRTLLREGVAVPVRVEGLRGEWFAHAELLDQPFRPRTTLLSPFDKLISNRARTEELFGFRFRLEIYVPKAKRQYGYFVLPVLAGDRLAGRVDPSFDRKSGELKVNAVHWENEPYDIDQPLAELARFVGADAVTGPRVGARS
jgi:uncharacterized protein YcaQ